MRPAESCSLTDRQRERDVGKWAKMRHDNTNKQIRLTHSIESDAHCSSYLRLSHLLFVCGNKMCGALARHDQIVTMRYTVFEPRLPWTKAANRFLADELIDNRCFDSCVFNNDVIVTENCVMTQVTNESCTDFTVCERWQAPLVLTYLIQLTVFLVAFVTLLFLGVINCAIRFISLTLSHTHIQCADLCDSIFVFVTFFFNGQTIDAMKFLFEAMTFRDDNKEYWWWSFTLLSSVSFSLAYPLYRN